MKDSDYLEHHGILGQKWGKKNGPPYPLDYEEHSAEEKKKNPKGRIDGDADTGYSKASKKRDSTNTRHAIASEYGSYEEEVDALLEENPNLAVASPNGSDWKKGLAVTGGIVGATVFATGIAYIALKENGEFFPGDALEGIDLTQPVEELIETAPSIEPTEILETPLQQLVQESPIESPKAVTNKVQDVVEQIQDIKIENIIEAEEPAKSDPRAEAIKFNREDPIGPLHIVPRSDEDFHDFPDGRRQWVGEWLSKDSEKSNPVSPDDPVFFSDKEIRLPIGTKMYRVSKNKHTNVRDTEFVSFEPEDRQRYLGFLPNMWAVRGRGTDNSYEMVLEGTQEIRAPSPKRQFEIYKDCLKRAFPGYTDEEYDADMLKNWRQYSIKLARDDKLNNMFREECRKQGYNAIIDTNDMGSLSKTPLILLKPAENTKVVGVNEYSFGQALDALENAELVGNKRVTFPENMDIQAYIHWTYPL